MGKYLADSYDAALRENGDLKTRLAEADANAPWLTQAHMICTDHGIPQGNISDRLEMLVGYLAEADALLREARQCLRQWCNGFMPILATGRCTNGIDTFLHDNGVNVSGRCPDCVDGAYAGTDRICRTCSGLGTIKRAAVIDAHLARKP